VSVQTISAWLFLRNSDGIYIDISHDVIGGLQVSQGITGNGLLDRTASTGTLKFRLQNIDNVYTPNHINCMADFAVGTTMYARIGVIEGYYRFKGTISQIDPVYGDGITNYVNVTVVDYIDMLARHELQLPAFAQNKKMEEVVALIIANMPVAPDLTDYGTGQDTFATVFDTTRSTTRALTEIAKVTQSELGMTWVETSSGERLCTRGRNGFQSVASSATFTDADIIGAEIEYGKDYYNEVVTETYPRRVDASATSVLFNLDRPVSVGAGETVTISGSYSDPDQKAVEVSGIDMVTPAATTDYLFNTAEDGTGTNITANLTVTATYGANGVNYALTNSYGSTGYVTKLQARGKGVYTFQPVTYSAEYSTGITAHGRRTLRVDMPYQDNPLVGVDFAQSILDAIKVIGLRVTSITYEANKSAALKAAFIALNIGDRITLNLSDYGLSLDAFITRADIDVSEGGLVTCTYGLLDEALTLAGSYWILDSASYSQLDETTKLGF